MTALDALNGLQAYIERHAFRGYDPYDALNSPVLRGLARSSKPLRIVFIQMMKKSPVNLRPLLGIRKGLNPKSLGLLLRGYLKRHASAPNAGSAGRIESLKRFLGETRSPGYSGDCWGYDFDWQSRAFYLPKGTPTAVNSCFNGRACLEAYALQGDPGALKSARSVCDFVLGDLNRLEDGETTAFSYSPLDRYFVHNATALASSHLAMTSKYTGEKALARAAGKAMGAVARRQRGDGTWPYGEDDVARKTGTDSFHNGFILESLKVYAEGAGDDTYHQTLKRGLEAYQEKFFLADGAPKYFLEKAFPFDIHSAAQAIIVLSSMRKEGADAGLCRKVLDWTLANLRDESGFFYYRKTGRATNRIPYMRWSQAWMFLALATYLEKHD